jgi:hypothetical protein
MYWTSFQGPNLGSIYSNKESEEAGPNSPSCLFKLTCFWMQTELIVVISADYFISDNVVGRLSILISCLQQNMKLFSGWTFK